MSSIVQVRNLCKKIGNKEILKNVSFDINEGEILGFIGPNGAGKTTTIKLMLGLQSIDSGSVTINGFDVVKDFERAIARVGTIVENPDLYMYMSGRKNLELIGRLYNINSKEKIDEIVDLIGLKNRIDDKVSKYSLGMRQRLGIGAALLSQPNVLILDEPTNGLDPEGIKDLRDLLKKLAKNEKIAILISSHNLAELESFITNVCLIQNGVVLETMTIQEMQKSSQPSYIFELNNTKHLKKDDYEFEIIDDNHVKFYCEREDIPKLVNLLVKEGFLIYEIKSVALSLEDAFLNKIGGNEIV